MVQARRPQIVRMDARGRDGDVHVGEDGVQPAEDRGAVLVFIQRSRGKCDERSEEADAQLHDVGLSPGAALKYVRAGREPNYSAQRRQKHLEL